jgi:HEPN domain-containing protein
MADVSPLLKGAMEEYSHAIEHMQSGSDIDNKFAIIHAATSIELILKDKLRSMSVSIFKKRVPHTSLGFYECIKLLRERNVPIPFEADIELLHEERNICVHLGGNPEKAKTEWLLEKAHDFLIDFCSKQLNIDIAHHFIPARIPAIAKRAHVTPAYIYLSDAHDSLYAGKYASAVFNASASVELVMRDYLRQKGVEVSPLLSEMQQKIENEKGIPMFILKKIPELRKLRNKIARLKESPTKKEAEGAIDLARFIIFEGFQESLIHERRCVICGSKKVVGGEYIRKLDVSKIKSKKDYEKALAKVRKSEEEKLVGLYCKKHEPYWTTR